MTKLTIDGYKNIVKNKYYYIYKRLIEKRLIEKIQPEVYGEIHHILPKCLGGNDIKDNLVKLTAKEHYVVHHLLCKFIIGFDKNRMILAFACMSNLIMEYTTSRYINSKTYETLKSELSLARSTLLKESWNNGSRNEQLKYMKENSPFNNPVIHKKTIDNRTKNGTNIWSTNNPMKDPIKAKEIASKRSGELHYSKTKTGYFNAKLNEYRYFDNNIILDNDWVKQGCIKNKITKAKGKPKSRIECPYCKNTYPHHTLKRHIKARHINKESNYENIEN